MKSQRAFTLTELLIVVVIIAVLIGLAMPVFVRARKQGYQASDVSQMHQLALAGAMYDSEFYTYPLDVDQVVKAQLIKPGICKLILDPYPQGLGNYFLTDGGGPDYLASKVTSYPQSFVTLGSLGYAPTRAQGVSQRPGAGWAITDEETNNFPNAKGPGFWGARYYRLGNDGSVTTHAVPIRQEVLKGSPGTTLHFLDMFFDSGK